MRLHIGTLLAGLIYVLVGIAFMLEGLSVWTVSFADLRIVVPLLMVAAGFAVVIGSLRRTDSSS